MQAGAVPRLFSSRFWTHITVQKQWLAVKTSGDLCKNNIEQKPCQGSGG
jgi:hypothetical protein